jgi:putative Ca2+/H+ antiporter (TMEM165/GDT1 family)
MAFIDSLLAAFALVFISELGDKTQLALVAFSAENPTHSKEIWLGASAAMTVLIIVGVFVGRTVAGFLEGQSVTILSSLVFLGFGIQTLFFGKKEGKTKGKQNAGKKGAGDKQDKQTLKQIKTAAFWTTFGFIAVSEIGDKSQIAVLTLAAAALTSSGALGVFAGALIAQVILAAVGVYFGKNVAQSLPRDLIRPFSGLLFLAAAAYPWIFGAA